MALDQQETFNQLVRQNNAMRTVLRRIESWLDPKESKNIEGGRLGALIEVREALATK